MPGHQRSGRTRGARNGRAVVRLLTAAVIALAFGRAIGQPLPGPDAYAAPGAPAGAARRGIDAWVTETSVRAEATLTNNANYGASATREGDLILEVRADVEVQPPGRAVARRRQRLARHVSRTSTERRSTASCRPRTFSRTWRRSTICSSSMPRSWSVSRSRTLFCPPPQGRRPTIYTRRHRCGWRLTCRERSGRMSAG